MKRLCQNRFAQVSLRTDVHVAMLHMTSASQMWGCGLESALSAGNSNKVPARNGAPEHTNSHYPHRMHKNSPNSVKPEQAENIDL